MFLFGARLPLQLPPCSGRFREIFLFDVRVFFFLSRLLYLFYHATSPSGAREACKAAFDLVSRVGLPAATIAASYDVVEEAKIYKICCLI